MARPKDPSSSHKVHLHKDKKYRYAATQVYYKDEQTGKLKHKYTFWGTVTEDLVFIPGPNYKLASKEVRDRLIFPQEWNLDAIQPIAGKDESLNSGEVEPLDTSLSTPENNPDCSNGGDGTSESNAIPDELSDNDDSSTEQLYFSPIPQNNPPDPTLSEDRSCLNSLAYSNKLYGAVWLLQELAIQCGLIKDLYEVFQNNLAVTNEIFVLSIVPYISRRSYSRVARWQNIYHTDVSFSMTAPYITHLTQSITSEHRLKIIKKRIDRVPAGTFNSLDSTSRSALGKYLADIRWGKNKENSKYPNTVEVYVYSLTNHEPVYYRSFPGNQHDVTTVRTIVDELEPMGINDLALIADRAYSSRDTLAILYEANIPFILCAKVSTAPVSTVLLNEVKYDADGLPVNLQYSEKYSLYYGQFTISDFECKTPDNVPVTIKDIKANVFLNMPKRVKELQALKINIDEEEKSIKKKVSKLKPDISSDDLKKVNALYCYFKIESQNNEKGDVSLVVQRKDQKISKAKSQCGFFSSLMHRVNQTGLEALETYKTRDEQEKSHELLKTLLDANTQECSSEDGKDGRSFILFCGMIITSKLRYGWKNSNLQYKYATSIDVMDEMEPIRYLENSDTMTTFSMNQFEICQCLGITPPRECLPATARKTFDRIQAE